MTIKHTMTVPYPVEQVAELLCSGRYAQETQKVREDIIDVRHQVLSDTDDEKTYQVSCTTYRRTKMGTLDKSSTEQSTVHFRFDKKTHILHWQREGEQGKWVIANGVTRLTPKDGGTEIDREVTLKIKIPVIGGPIQKIVEREFRKAYQRQESQIRSLLEG